MGTNFPKPPAGSTSPFRGPVVTVFANKFGCLAPLEERAATNTYGTIIGMLRTRRRLPSTVWADMDDTLYRRRQRRDVLQGHVIGMLGAFRDAGIDVGIFSTNPEEKISSFVEQHGIIAQLLDRGRGSDPLIRGAAHLSREGSDMSMPRFQIGSALGYFFFRSGKSRITEQVPKLVGEDEILVDDFDHTRVYDRFDRLCKPRVRDWEFTPLAKAIRISREGFFHVAARGYAKGLTSDELARLDVILNHIESL
jgi:hypothetical protein